jgi:hypothetical protein
MPVQINELVIKVEVSDENKNSAKPATGNSANKTLNDQIIAACVEKVMELLNDKKER